MTEARRQGLIGHALEMLPKRIDRGIDQGLAFLARRQNPDGSWSPLWFGNQDHPDEDNPVYGTAKVLLAYRDLALMNSPEAKRGIAWLVANQNKDGGWGSGAWGRIVTQETLASSPQTLNPKPQSAIRNLKSSVEETALATEALLAAIPSNPDPRALNPTSAALHRGLAWLLDRVEQNHHRQPAPIGFYFAKLWYYERLYPLIFTTAALGRACRQFAPSPPKDGSDEICSTEDCTSRSP
jgi:squalene-hopene/tetraprenyl-beta-curcumene cyclase